MCVLPTIPNGKRKPRGFTESEREILSGSGGDISRLVSHIVHRIFVEGPIAYCTLKHFDATFREFGHLRKLQKGYTCTSSIRTLLGSLRNCLFDRNEKLCTKVLQTFYNRSDRCNYRKYRFCRVYRTMSD